MELFREDNSADAVAAEQSRQNRTTQNQWGFYDSHRRSLERLIVPDARGGRICILGAGNCNDLDLKWLTGVYREVHLVDLDAASLAAAVARQGLATCGAIVRHAPIDLTGVAPIVAGWGSAPPGEREMESVRLKLLEPPLAEWGEFEMVLSPCVLTQTINPVRRALREKYPPSHPLRVAILTALRVRHLRYIAASVAAGGRGVLAIDLISSEKYPDLPRLPADQLESFMRTFVADGKHYAGLHPGGLLSAWREDGECSRRLSSPRFSQPWLWHLGLKKSFLVYGVTFDRRA